MKNGFDRLKGLAAASSIGLGLLTAGSARAISVTIGDSVRKNLEIIKTYPNADKATWRINHAFARPLPTLETSTVVAYGIDNAHFLKNVTASNGVENKLFTAVFHGLFMAVDDVIFRNPSIFVDLTDNTVTSRPSTDFVLGLNTQVQYYFAPDIPVVRALYTYENITDTDMTFTVRIKGILSSRENTIIQATSNENEIAEDSDLWYVTNTSGVLNVESFDSPTVATSRHGIDAPIQAVDDETPGQALKAPNGPATPVFNEYSFRYDNVVAPAGKIVRLMAFMHISDTIDGAVIGAKRFENLATANKAGLLQNLTATTLSEIVNYGTDTDFDGVIDTKDAFPNNPAETADSDNDGVGDNADAFPNDPTENTDTDKDGVGDNADAFPTDPNETTDTDKDTVGDNADAFPNDPNETTDTDFDNVGDNSDNCPVDVNTDQLDTDSDNVGDVCDAFPLDVTEFLDSDGDGVGDNADIFPRDNGETIDSDGDGIGDNADDFPFDSTETLDSDQDGVGDNADAFPNDPSQSSLPTANTGGGGGSISAYGLFSLFGLLPILRRRRKTK